MKPLTIGLISDTHGLLRPQALDALRGSDFLIHAGDIGDPGILEQLAAIAPLTAVRGNNDIDSAYDGVPERAWLELDALRIYILHNRNELDPRTAWSAERCPAAVISGHSHKPMSERRDGVLYVNPGSCGPRRFKLPVSVGRLLIVGTQVEAQLIELALD